MDEEELVTLLMISACSLEIIENLDQLPKKRKRRIWVRNWLRKRSDRSVYSNIHYLRFRFFTYITLFAFSTFYS